MAIDNNDATDDDSDGGDDDYDDGGDGCDVMVMAMMMTVVTQ